MLTLWCIVELRVVIICFFFFFFPFFHSVSMEFDFEINNFQTGAKMAFEKFMHVKHTVIEKKSKIGMYRCGLCGCSSNSFQLVRTDFDQKGKKIDISSSDTSIREHEVWKQLH